MFKSLNKSISAPIAIIIIVVCALLVGGIVVYQYYGMPKEEEETSETIKLPEDETPKDETADWKTYRFVVKELEEIEGITEEKRQEVQKKIKERKLENCSFEIKYPPSWTAYTWPLHGFIVPEGLFIEEDPESHNGCSFQMSFYGDPEKEKYCFPISFSSGESDSEGCNKIFNQMLSTFGFIDPHTGKKQVNIIKLCESNLLEEELGKENVILLNFDDDNDKEILLGWPAIKAVDPHFFYVLDKQGESCSIVWKKSSYGDFKMKSVANLAVNDLDKDGIDEIIISGYNSGGTCTYGVNYNFIYSPKSNQLFWSENWEGYLVDNSKRTDVFCTEKIIKKGDIGCDGNDLVNSTCFSNNLKEDTNQIFKKYLDELLIKQ